MFEVQNYAIIKVFMYQNGRPLATTSGVYHMSRDYHLPAQIDSGLWLKLIWDIRTFWAKPTAKYSVQDETHQALSCMEPLCLGKRLVSFILRA